MKILSFGSINIDKVFSVSHIVARGETLAATGYAEYAGGKGANQTIAMARSLGEDSGIHLSIAGQVGKDGTWLVDLLRGSGVDVSEVVVSGSHNTGCALIQREASGDNAILLVPGANTCITLNHISSTIAKFSSGDWLLLQNEINNVPEIIRDAKFRGIKVLFNPAPCPQDIKSFPLNSIDILVLNQVEADAFFKAILESADDDTLENRLRKLMGKLPNLEAVVVTVGELGAVACLRKNTSIDFVKVSALRDCHVRDTTGAGDTFVGYFLSQYAKLRSLPDAFEESMRISAIASGIACETHGAIPSIPHFASVEERMAKK